MSHPDDLRYSKEHEWVRVDGDKATIGITSFAADELGDIVFVELPEVGATLSQFGTFGVVESVKAVSDLYSPISGEVVAVNEKLRETPEIEDVAVFPMAMPMLAGPGAIASIMLLAGSASGVRETLVVLAALLAVLLLTLLALWAASPLMKLVGAQVEAVITRLLGVLLAALAAQYVFDGVRGTFGL